MSSCAFAHNATTLKGRRKDARQRSQRPGEQEKGGGGFGAGGGSTALETNPVQEEAGKSRCSILPPPCISTHRCLFILLTYKEPRREGKKDSTHCSQPHVDATNSTNKYFIAMMDIGVKY